MAPKPMLKKPAAASCSPAPSFSGSSAAPQSPGPQASAQPAQGVASASLEVASASSATAVAEQDSHVASASPARSPAMPVLVQESFDKFTVDPRRWRWFTVSVPDERLRDRLRVALAQQSLKRGDDNKRLQTAVEWDSLRLSSDGLALHWKRAVQYKTGWQWWKNRLESIKANVNDYLVTAHRPACPEGYVLAGTSVSAAHAALPRMPTASAGPASTPNVATSSAMLAPAATGTGSFYEAFQTSQASDYELGCPQFKVRRLCDALQGESGIGPSASAYEGGTEIGRGSYGVVHRIGFRGADLAVKQFDASAVLHALAEVGIADKLPRSPHLINLLDCTANHDSQVSFLVYPYLGVTLRSVLEPPQPCLVQADVVAITKHICLGLSVLHDLGLYHSDLKPENILVQSTPQTSGWHVRVADLGGVVEVGFGARLVKLHHSRTTVWYCAPELLAKASQWKADHLLRADVWALGAIVSQMVRLSWHMVPVKKRNDDHGFKHQLGQLRLKFLDGTGVSKPMPWPEHLYHDFGSHTVEFLDGLVAWDPMSRPSIAMCLRHRFLLGDTFCCPSEWGSLGASALPGARHPWSFVMGHMCPRVLAWLREDCVSLAKLKSLEKASQQPQFHKTVVPGKMVADPGSKSLNGNTIHEFLPLPRLRAWLQAWKEVNATVLATLAAGVKIALGALDGPIGSNGTHAKDTDWTTWFLTAAELHIFDKPGTMEEPKHFDGGASVVHMGITLHGRRLLRLWTPGGDASTDHVEVQLLPGSVYVGTLTGPEHQVVHMLPRASAECCDDHSVTIMVRTTLFPHNMARTMKNLPVPKAMFEALTSAVRHTIASASWRFPSHCLCQRHHQVIVGTAVA